MKTFNLALPFLLASTTIATLRGGVEQKVQEAIKNTEAHLETLNLDHIDLSDEREARIICTRILGMLEVVPDELTCFCNPKLRTMRIDFGCSLEEEMCILEAGDLDDDGMLTLNDDVCVKPSYIGTFRLGRRLLTSEVCNEPISASLTMGKDTAEEDTMTLDLPRVCATATHAKGIRSILEEGITECGIAFGGEGLFGGRPEECTCEVCEDGFSAKIDCSMISALGDLAEMAKIEECIGLDMMGMKSERNHVGPIQPLLSGIMKNLEGR